MLCTSLSIDAALLPLPSTLVPPASRAFVAAALAILVTAQLVVARTMLAGLVDLVIVY